MTPFLPRPKACPLERPDALRRRLLLAASGAGAGALLLPLHGCGGGSELLFAPIFVFSYVGVVERRIVSVNFQTTGVSADGASGRFDETQASINIDDPLGADDHRHLLSGDFSNRNLRITVAAPQSPLVARYTGRFLDGDTVEFTPEGPGSAFTVHRNENDRFLPALSGDWVGQDASGQPWRLSLATDPAGNDAEPAVLLVGTEQLGSAAPVPLQGHAAVDSLRLVIQRAGGNVTLDATLTSTGAAPTTTQAINFAGGGSLRRP